VISLVYLTLIPDGTSSLQKTMKGVIDCESEGRDCDEVISSTRDESGGK